MQVDKKAIYSSMDRLVEFMGRAVLVALPTHLKLVVMVDFDSWADFEFYAVPEDLCKNNKKSPTLYVRLYRHGEDMEYDEQKQVMSFLAGNPSESQ